jgi:Helix-turn-helix domain of transposase family ISL3
MTTVNRRGKRTRLYETAIAALLTETTIEKAAMKCNVSYSTIGRWMKEPEFIALYNDAKQNLLESVKNSLRQLGEKAVGALNDAMTGGPVVSTGDKLNASKFVLDKLLAFEITDSLNVRLQQLESSNEAE